MKQLRAFRRRLRSEWSRLRLRLRGISAGPGLSLDSGCRVLTWDGGRIVLGANVTLGQGVSISVCGGGSLTVGDGVNLHAGTRLQCTGDMVIGPGAFLVDGTIIYCEGRVMIGADCLLAAYTLITDVQHRHDRLDIPIKGQGNTVARPVVIGDGAWVGTKATIMDGVTIGTGAIVGANAVVTRDIPDFAVAVGIPAKVIRYRGDDRSAEDLRAVGITLGPEPRRH